MRSYVLVCGADIATLRASEELYKLGHEYHVEIGIAEGDENSTVPPGSEKSIEVAVRDVVPSGDTATLLCTISSDDLAVYPDLGRFRNFRVSDTTCARPNRQ